MRSYKNYCELPLRQIIDIPFTKCRSPTFAVIVYASDTDRWLMMQRRHSIGLLRLLKGRFMVSETPSIVSTLTRNEMDIIRSALTSKEKYLTILFNTYQVKVKNSDIYWDLLVNAKDIILRSLDKYRDNDNHLDWLWAKGYKKVSIDDEDPQDTAMRELNEESGITHITCHHVISKECIDYNQVSTFGEIFSTKCKVCIFENEITIPEVSDSEVEVVDRKWMTTSEVMDIISGVELEVFVKAKGIVDAVLN